MTPDGNGPDSGETKPSNPKDLIGSRKLPTGLVPDTAVAFMSEAFLEGALKYGRYNWRIAGVSAAIYRDALDRHLKKWWNGQDCDPKTDVHHLASIMACAAIMLDARLYGKLDDNRPPCPNPDAMADLIDSGEHTVARLKEVFADHKPYQFTIADTQPEIAEDGFVTMDQARAMFGLPPVSAQSAEQQHLDRMTRSPMPETSGPIVFGGPIAMACGCFGFCKGHVDETVRLDNGVTMHVAPKGPKDPSGQSYFATERSASRAIDLPVGDVIAGD